MGTPRIIRVVAEGFKGKQRQQKKQQLDLIKQAFIERPQASSPGNGKKG